MPRCAAVWIVFAGCGRIAFEPRDDVTPDVAARCTAYGPIVGASGLYRMGTTDDTWTAAQLDCASDGGHLVIFDDVAEATAIWTPVARSMWIGVTDQADEAVFVTVLGTPPPYLPWGTGEPNNASDATYPEGQDCVQAVDFDVMDDHHCRTILRPYACECAP